jgi:hypothetical protein
MVQSAERVFGHGSEPLERGVSKLQTCPEKAAEICLFTWSLWHALNVSFVLITTQRLSAQLPVVAIEHPATSIGRQSELESREGYWTDQNQGELTITAGV